MGTSVLSSIIPTVKLNGLAMERQEPAISVPLNQKPVPSRANYIFCGMYDRRYHYPMPKVFYVQLTRGEHAFFGEGKTLHNASEISTIFQIALKHNMPASFEWSPHMKSFVTQVSVGDFSGGDGNSKQFSKKYAAIIVLQELQKLSLLLVKVGHEITTGTGPKKKIAKRNASEAMLLQLGYKASSLLQEQPEMRISCNKTSPSASINYLTSKEMSQTSICFFSISPATKNTATIARELLMNGTSSSGKAIGLKGVLSQRRVRDEHHPLELVMTEQGKPLNISAAAKLDVVLYTYSLTSFLVSTASAQYSATVALFPDAYVHLCDFVTYLDEWLVDVTT
ncbi:LOW QUALITY PROTEIN: double-stranded RNA-binding protein Staufen homolog 2 [Vipera latastei]